jgi:hypothetical protein
MADNSFNSLFSDYHSKEAHEFRDRREAAKKEALDGAREVRLRAEQEAHERKSSRTMELLVAMLKVLRTTWFRSMKSWLRRIGPCIPLAKKARWRRGELSGGSERSLGETSPPNILISGKDTYLISNCAIG